MSAARSAGAHDFIMSLSDGYETMIGGGSNRQLSGGERQRISIARAIVTQPRILILDEATAAMDNETEQRIARAISVLIKGKTTISIAHRLSTLRDCDRIMAIEGGRLLEAGTREELLAKKGRGSLVFVGDGMNDAPVLARADVGIAMGAMGSDAAIEAADVVLMDDDPTKVARSISISRKCISIVHQNVVFAIGIKLLCLLLGALGIANMWLAIFADVGVMVLAVLNAIRALFVKK